MTKCAWFCVGIVCSPKTYSMYRKNDFHNKQMTLQTHSELLKEG